MKVNSTVYKGIEYIQVRELPPDQQEVLLHSINRELLIKIIVEGKAISNCLLFKDYEIWFDRVFAAQNTLERDPSTPAGPTDLKPDQSQIPVSGTTSNTLSSGSLK